MCSSVLMHVSLINVHMHPSPPNSASACVSKKSIWTLAYLVQVLQQVDEPLQPLTRSYVTPECGLPNLLSRQQWPESSRATQQQCMQVVVNRSTSLPHHWLTAVSNAVWETQIICHRQRLAENTHPRASTVHCNFTTFDSSNYYNFHTY